MSDRSSRSIMYLAAYPLAIAFLVFWALMTFRFGGPGWAHLFLTLGVFLLIWRITAGGTERAWREYVARRGERAGRPRRPNQG